MTMPLGDPVEETAAVRDIHEARLHGFALLITHGDRPAAAHLANAVMEAYRSPSPTTAHPERTAAVLRADLLRRARRLRRSTIDDEERHAALGALNVDASAVEALRALGVTARAALVAADIEQFTPEDVALILNMSPAAARRAVRHARRQYIAMHPGPPPGVVGPLRTRIAKVAGRTFGAAEAVQP